MGNVPASRGLPRGARWGLGLGAAALGLILWGPLSQLIWQILFALLLTAAALPLCKRMEGRIGRKPAALVSVSSLALGLIGLAALTTPLVISQVTLVINEAPRWLQTATDMWQDLSQHEWMRLLGLDKIGPSEWAARAAAWLSGSLPGLLAGMVSGIDAISKTFLSPVMAYYFLRDREMFAYRASLWIPGKYRRRVLAAWQEMRREAGGYLRGQTLVAVAVAALTALGLRLVGIPAWLILGLVMGACEWIPYVGPLIGGAPIALFSLPLGMEKLLWGLGVTIFVQQVEGYYLSPRLMSGAMDLHPVYVLGLLSAGGLLGGLPGMVAALPLFVCARGAVRVLTARGADEADEVKT